MKILQAILLRRCITTQTPSSSTSCVNVTARETQTKLENNNKNIAV